MKCPYCRGRVQVESQADYYRLSQDLVRAYCTECGAGTYWVDPRDIGNSRFWNEKRPNPYNI